MSEDFSMPVANSPSSGNNNGGRGGGNNNRRRRNNRNRNASKSKSRSPSHDGDGRRNQRRGKQSLSPTRQNNKSRSPIRHNNKSRSPVRRQGNGHNHQYHHHHHHQQHFHHPVHYKDKKFAKHAAAMTIVVKRTDLWDSAAHFQPDENLLHPAHIPDCIVAPYHFGPDVAHLLDPSRKQTPEPQTVCVARVPHVFQKCSLPMQNHSWQNCDVIDTSIKNPHDPNVVHDKYWAQRRRLFSRFDQGIQLDSEGWYSVTPEIIADHVAHRVATLATSIDFPRERDDQGIVILDAFCGCGGNSIAFGKVPTHLISKVICVDTDRSKLLKAAHNASLYDIPRDKLVFIECNSAFILQHCYRNGEFILDQPSATLPPHMPKPVMSTIHAGYHVGGIDMLPRRVDAVFMDPPWGGVDYEVLGKNGYDLQKNMKIQVAPAVEPEIEGVSDDFFDSFCSAPQTNKMSQKARRANFNKKTEGLFIDGMELLKFAAEATSSRLAIYDLPRNTNKTSLGKCALLAGYRGNIKLEEHYLNGRLKTVTAYMGADYSDMINSLHDTPKPAEENAVQSNDVPSQT